MDERERALAVGLTEQEAKCWELAGTLAGQLYRLPVLHKTDWHDLVHAIHIPGRDVRVHVVQDQVFPTEVLATGVDYRFDDEGGQFRAIAIPPSLAALCCAFAGAEGLIVAGFDFRVMPDGDWYCLEMNPVPTFLPYEMATSQHIGDAILDIFKPVGLEKEHAQCLLGRKNSAAL